MTAQDIAAALIAAPRLTYDSLEPLREPPGVVQHRTRGGAWVGWVMVRHIPGLGQCSERPGALPPAETIPGCDNENCRKCPRNVAEAREVGAVFVDGGWS